MRRLLLWLLSPVYEVRVINVKTGKNVPGTRVHSGESYKKAMAAYRAYKPKYGFQIKIQAVTVFNTRINSEKLIIIDEVSEVNPGMYRAEVPAEDMDMEGAVVTVAMSDDFIVVPEDVSRDSPHVPGEVYVVGEEHACDYAGPMGFHEGAYKATCSVCGDLQL